MGILAREESERLNNLRAKAAKEAGNACIDWVVDTGGCHFCEPDVNAVHDEECPLYTYFLELAKARGVKVGG